MPNAAATRIVGIDGLRARLRAVLGADSLLCRRFERALATRDPERVAAAMDALALHPAHLREQVEEAILAWLLDGVAQEPPRRPEGLGRG